MARTFAIASRVLRVPKVVYYSTAILKAMLRTSALVVIAVLLDPLVFLAEDSRVLGQEAEARALVESKVLPGWRSIRKNVSGLMGEFRILSKEHIPKTTTETIDMRFFFKGDLLRIEQVLGPEKKVGLVTAISSNYEFMVKRTNEPSEWGEEGQGSDGFALKDYEAIRNDGRGPVRTHVRFYKWYPLAGLSACAFQMDEIAANCNLLVTKASSLPNDKLMLCGEVRSKTDDAHLWNFVLHTVPARSYAITYSKLEYPTYYETCDTRLSDAADGAFPKSLVMKTYLNDGELTEERSVEFSTPSKCDLAKKDFGLEAFGIIPPPLPTVQDSSDGLRRWGISVLASILFLLSVLAWKKLRER
jgi:hypothetical protein